MEGGEAEACCTVDVTSEGVGGVLDTVARISSELASGENGGGEAVLLESLRQLQAVPMTFQVLEATKVGRAVNAPRKNASSDLARELAASLFARWKALAEEHFRSQSPVSVARTDASSEKKLAPLSSPETPNAAADKGAKRSLPVKTKPTAAPSVSNACKRKANVSTSSSDTATVKKQRSTLTLSEATRKTEQPPVAIRQRAAAVPKATPASSKPSVKIPSVAKPAASLANKAKQLPAGAAPPPKPSCSSGRKVKRRLQEGYKEAAAAKEKRRIQFISAPGQATRGPVVVRRREVLRCGAAIGAVKQAPVTGAFFSQDVLEPHEQQAAGVGVY